MPAKTNVAYDDLKVAAENGNTDRVREIITQFPELVVGTGDATDYKPLHHAAHGDHVEAIALLAKPSRNVLVTGGENRDTALHVAASSNSLESIGALLAHAKEHRDFLLNAQNLRGDTAAHIAFKKGRTGALKALKDEGANLSLPDGHGKTVAKLIEERAQELQEEIQRNNDMAAVVGVSVSGKPIPEESDWAKRIKEKPTSGLAAKF